MLIVGSALKANAIWPKRIGTKPTNLGGDFRCGKGELTCHRGGNIDHLQSPPFKAYTFQ